MCNFILQFVVGKQFSGRRMSRSLSLVSNRELSGRNCFKKKYKKNQRRNTKKWISVFCDLSDILKIILQDRFLVSISTHTRIIYIYRCLSVYDACNVLLNRI